MGLPSTSKWEHREEKPSAKKTRSEDFPDGPVAKNSPCNARDTGWIPGREAKTPQAHIQQYSRACTATTRKSMCCQLKSPRAATREST